CLECSDAGEIHWLCLCELLTAQVIQEHPPPFIHRSVTALGGEVDSGAHILDPEALPAVHDVQRVNKSLVQIDVEGPGHSPSVLHPLSGVGTELLLSNLSAAR